MDRNKAVILVVEDDKTGLQLLFEFLANAGYQVITASHGKAALDAVKKQTPDLVLLDILLPDIHGFELSRQLNKIDGFYDVPIIFLSALTKEEHKVKGLKLGAADYITKPIQPNEVLARVEKQLIISRLQKDLREKNEHLNKEIETRKKTEAVLRHAHKMESIGTLSGGISHEFNNILGIIMGNAELAADEVEEGSALDDYLGEILNATLRGKAVVTQLLNFSRKSNYEIEPVYLAPAIKNTVELLKASLPNNISFRFRINDDDFVISGNTDQIRQMLISLCTNSAQAMKEDGVIDLELENVWLNKGHDALDSDMIPGNYIRLCIKDSGEGISPENIDRVFDPYFTTRSLSEGIGMGLAVVHGIVKSHNGSIRAESSLGLGATFNIYLPAIKKESGDAPCEAVSCPGKIEHLLLVDDETSIVKMQEKRLKLLGYKVTAFINPEEALKYYRENAKEVDLILTDMTMPQMSGTRLIEEARKTRPDVKAILCTGYSNKVDNDLSAEWGINAFLLKPFERNVLASTIRKVLDNDFTEQLFQDQ